MTSGIDAIPTMVGGYLRVEGFNPDDPLVQAAYLAAFDIAVRADSAFEFADVGDDFRVAADHHTVALWTLIIIRRVPAFQRQ